MPGAMPGLPIAVAMSAALFTTMTITYQVYRLLDDGEEQSLGYFVNDRDAMIKAFDYYSEVRYPHSYVDYREV